MRADRSPMRDPRTVARDIPGVLDVLFPRLTAGLVNSLNAAMFAFEGIEPLREPDIEASTLQNAMLFEVSVARAENEIFEGGAASWEDCLALAASRQRRHFDARIPAFLGPEDIAIAGRAAGNLVSMLKAVAAQRPGAALERAPLIPGLGWVASGNGDFALGATLIEVKHTGRNFGASDFRQVLMYWLLKYARAVETDGEIWSEVLLLNPRRNASLLLNYDHVLRSASASSNRVELVELLRSAVGQDADRR